MLNAIIALWGGLTLWTLAESGHPLLAIVPAVGLANGLWRHNRKERAARLGPALGAPPPVPESLQAELRRERALRVLGMASFAVNVTFPVWAIVAWVVQGSFWWGVATGVGCLVLGFALAMPVAYLSDRARARQAQLPEQEQAARAEERQKYEAAKAARSAAAAKVEAAHEASQRTAQSKVEQNRAASRAASAKRMAANAGAGEPVYTCGADLPGPDGRHGVAVVTGTHFLCEAGKRKVAVPLSSVTRVYRDAAGAACVVSDTEELAFQIRYASWEVFYAAMTDDRPAPPRRAASDAALDHLTWST